MSYAKLTKKAVYSFLYNEYVLPHKTAMFSIRLFGSLDQIMKCNMTIKTYDEYIVTPFK